MTLRRPLVLFLLLLLAATVAGCSSTGGRKKGGYYKDDGPDTHPPANLDRVPDAVPRIEPLASGPNRPYIAFGKRYVPDTSGQPYKQRGRASWYGKKFHGNPTSNGESYNMYAMTAAHPTLPIPSYARVTSMVNGRTVIVRVNDRGPFHSERIIDLSYVAAYKLGLIGPGSGEVVVESIQRDEIRRMATQRPPSTSAAGPTSAPYTSGATPRTPPWAQGAPTPLATGIYLQVGAFSQSLNAQALAGQVRDSLANRGIPPPVIEQARNLYRVKIGPYPSREAALQAVQTVTDYIGIVPSIIMP
jgi:rare lipoprotein A